MNNIKTYIIQTQQGEYYCGKTNNIERRLKQHQNENKPHWFAFKRRKQWKMIIEIQGDCEKKIKSFGVKRFAEIEKVIRRPLS